jgi:hypothetical protein
MDDTYDTHNPQSPYFIQTYEEEWEKKERKAELDFEAQRES